MVLDNGNTDKKPNDPDTVIFNIILGQLGTDKEGSDLGDFARQKQIKFRFGWGLHAAEWLPRENTILCGKSGYTSAEVIGAIACQLRHAAQSFAVPELDNVGDEGLFKTSLRKQVLLLRLTEGDAKSYEIAMRVALEKRGIIEDAAASFAGISREDAFIISSGDPAPGGISLAKVEVYHYIKMFQKSFEADPFSTEARAHAFAFLQQSKLFREEFDEAFLTKFDLACNAHKSTKESFDYAARTPLPDFAAAAAAISGCKTDAKQGGYLGDADIALLETHILGQLNPGLLAMINFTEGQPATPAATPPKTEKPFKNT